MNTTAPTTTATKIPIRTIAINQAEGETARLIKATVSTWAAANILLARICAAAPKDGSYFKTDFVVTWQDGNTYSGRFDACNPGYINAEPADLERHIRSHVEYLAGYRCPAHLDQATYEHQLVVGEKASPGRGAEARAFLVKYNLKDDPNAKPAEVQVQGRERRHVPVPAPAKSTPLVPQSLTDKLATLETMLAHTLQEAETLLPVLLATKTADRAQDVATYTKAKARSLEIRKALAAVIKARE